MARVAVVGGGFVGVTTAVVFAEHGHDCVLVEQDAARLAALQAGKVPFFEPGIADAMAAVLRAGRLRVARDVAAAVPDADFVFLCVGTPQAADGSMDLRQVEGAAREVALAMRPGGARPIVVVKSTVVPGTCADVVAPLLAAGPGRGQGAAAAVASNPEFLREGQALQDARQPDRIVVGADQPGVAKAVLALYAGFSCPKLEVSTRTAEMVKYASNSFLAVKVALSNEFANLCQRTGVDWVDVAAGLGLDARIGPQFLRAGAGFGGSCFPKDLQAIASVARRAQAEAGILEAALRNNERQPLEAVRLLEEALGPLAGRRVALLGLAFKPDTDDVRETRALPIWRELRRRGADVVCHDPRAAQTFRVLAPEATCAATAEEALRGADGCIVQAEWREYRELPLPRLREWMARPVVVDGRRAFDPAAMAAAGVDYRAIGLGRPPPRQA